MPESQPLSHPESDTEISSLSSITAFPDKGIQELQTISVLRQLLS